VKGDPIVKALGIFTAGMVTAVAALALVVAVRSLPDVQRYLKIRSM
jgi:hypothetical protein